MNCGLFYIAYGNYARKFGWNFNQKFSFLFKSNLKSLFVCDTKYWLQFNACSHESRSQKFNIITGNAFL